MPDWGWTAALFAAVILLFVFIYKVAGGEPLDRQDNGGGDDAGHSGHGHGGGGGADD